jgi:hypothetical protein
MFPNWTGWKTVKQVLAILGTVAASLSAANQGTQTGNIASIVGVIVGALSTVVIALSGTALGPTVVAGKP